MVQTDTAALGRMVDENSVSGLPLVTRNFAQITGLSPGVTVGVYNAGEFGLGGTALSQIAQSNDGIFAHGSRSYDNNFQMDGISVSDVQESAGGVAEFLYRILTVSRSSKYRQDSTTLFMDVMPVPTSA
jgi:hypothetical protein